MLFQMRKKILLLIICVIHKMLRYSRKRVSKLLVRLCHLLDFKHQRQHHVKFFASFSSSFSIDNGRDRRKEQLLFENRMHSQLDEEFVHEPVCFGLFFQTLEQRENFAYDAAKECRAQCFGLWLIDRGLP